MAPIARHVIKMTQRIKNSNFRNLTLQLIEEATKQPDLGHFTSATLKNPSHTSRSEARPHATALLATKEQAENNKSQAIHIFHDEQGNYTGHVLFEERENKESDD